MGLKYINIFLLTLIACLLSACGDSRTVLERIIDSGELRFATVEGPATHFLNIGNDVGFEYELAKKFADTLGIDLKIIIVPYAREVIHMVALGKAHIGAAGLVDNSTEKNIQFGPGYNKVTQQVVSRHGGYRPVSVDDIRYGDLNIISLTQYVKLMQDIEHQHPQFSWLEYPEKSINTLLGLVHRQKMIATVANSTQVNLYKHLYPNIRAAFDITAEQSQSWIYKKREDVSLHNAIAEFFAKIKKNGDLEKLIERYFRHFETFNYVDVRTYLERIEDRLPEFKTLFKQSADKYHMDWRTLAALSYQESHWKPSARSPTGVRGLMMLTLDTAKQLGVDNRLDPEQSIKGGARYLAELYSKIPERIKDPDRIWFALASYNVGFEHLEDARMLTEKQGSNPDNWNDVRERLPLLSEEKWYKQTRYGYARGNEPVVFVENIRRYRDILSWINSMERKPKQKPEKFQSLFIDSPVL